MLGNLSQIGSEFVFVTDRNFDNRLARGTRGCRLQGGLQRVLDGRFEFIEASSSRRIKKNSDRRVSRRQLDHARNGGQFKRSTSPQHRIQ